MCVKEALIWLVCQKELCPYEYANERCQTTEISISNIVRGIRRQKCTKSWFAYHFYYYCHGSDKGVFMVFFAVIVFQMIVLQWNGGKRGDSKPDIYTHVLFLYFIM